MGGREIPIPKALKRLFYSWTTGDRLQKKDEGDSLVTALVSEHVRDNGGRGGASEHPASGAAATFNPGFSFRAQKWCPEAATFASASLLPPPPTRPPFPSPTGGATTGNQGREQAGGPAGWASHPETTSAEAHCPAPRRGARSARSRGLRRMGSRRAASA